MRQLLKQALTQHVQVLGRNFKSLDLSVLPWNEVQISSLETLRMSIQRLKQTIGYASPSDGPLDARTRQELYNELTIIIGFSQILFFKEAGDLSLLSSAALQTILKTSAQIQDALEADKVHLAPKSDSQIPQYNWASVPRPSR